MNTIAEFGYNTELEPDDYVAWAHIGSKYNFNIKGKVLVVFSANDQSFLLSQVTSSFGDNCMVGTIDVREIVIGDEELFPFIVSNNEPSRECMTISRMLSCKSVRDSLSVGKLIEQTSSFDALARLGIELERRDSQFGEEITVCGVEKEKFEHLKNTKTGKIKQKSKV